MNTMELIEESLKRGLGVCNDEGVLLVDTGAFTGRAAKNRYLVDHPELKESVDWGKVNKPLDVTLSHQIFEKLASRLQGEKTYSMDGYVSAFPISVTSTSPWHIAFAKNMFRSEPIEALTSRLPKDKTIQVFHYPFGTTEDLGISGAPNTTIILLDLVELKVAIIGTAYAGEIKKSAFTICNYRLVDFGFFPMHASANCLHNGDDSCVLFGLSGTGKTTLSASPERYLIGDDEIVWTPKGLSNLEGGCYAKLINLSEDKEPEIYRACNKMGAILENVSHNSEMKIDFSNASKTENTRGSYPIEALGDTVYVQDREAQAPKNVVFLTADAFGALPAVARLDFNQAQYHFISGYTAKVAGTEMGLKEPQATFSACFGAPFMPRSPVVYAELLADFLRKENATVWLLNTGWTGGAYGVGKRFPMHITRAILEAIQSGELAKQPTQRHGVFGFEVPTVCPGVDPKYLAVPTGERVDLVAKKFRENMKSLGLRSSVLDLGSPQLLDQRMRHMEDRTPSTSAPSLV